MYINRSPMVAESITHMFNKRYPDTDKLRKLADAWVASGKRAISAEIDAGSCHTPKDFVRAMRAFEKLLDAEATAEYAFNAALRSPS